MRIVMGILLMCLMSCCSVQAKDLSGFTGVNNSWANCALHYRQPEMISAIEDLNIKVVRFPGGAVSGRYNWVSGTTLPKNPNDNMIYRNLDIDDFMVWAEENNLKVIYVLNPTESASSAIALINYCEVNGYPIEGYELGNEVYWGQIRKHLGLPKIMVEDYYEWCLGIATNADTEVPFGLCLADVWVPGNDWARRTGWNDYLAAQDLSEFKALVYHYYPKVEHDMAAIFEDGTDYLQENFPEKKYWLTETNIHRIDKIEGYKDSSEHAQGVRDIYANVLVNKLDIVCFHSLQGTAFSLFWPKPPWSFWQDRVVDWFGYSDPVEVEHGEVFETLKIVFDVFTVGG